MQGLFCDSATKCNSTVGKYRYNSLSSSFESDWVLQHNLTRINSDGYWNFLSYSEDDHTLYSATIVQNNWSSQTQLVAIDEASKNGDPKWAAKIAMYFSRLKHKYEDANTSYVVIVSDSSFTVMTQNLGYGEK